MSCTVPESRCPLTKCSDPKRIDRIDPPENRSAVNLRPCEGDGAFHPLLEIFSSAGAGRGLRSRRLIPAGTVLFVAPTIRVPGWQYHQHCMHTVFEEYLFVGKSGDYHLALHLGRFVPCVCRYLCMHVCRYLCMHVCMYVCRYLCMHVCRYLCMHVCM